MFKLEKNCFLTCNIGGNFTEENVISIESGKNGSGSEMSAHPLRSSVCNGDLERVWKRREREEWGMGTLVSVRVQRDVSGWRCLMSEIQQAFLS